MDKPTYKPGQGINWRNPKFPKADPLHAEILKVEALALLLNTGQRIPFSWVLDDGHPAAATPPKAHSVPPPHSAAPPAPAPSAPVPKDRHHAPRACRECGKQYTPTGACQRYCLPCRKLVSRAAQARHYRHTHPFADQDRYCTRCNEKYTPTGRTQKYCEGCAQAKKLEWAAEHRRKAKLKAAPPAAGSKLNYPGSFLPRPIIPRYDLPPDYQAASLLPPFDSLPPAHPVPKAAPHSAVEAALSPFVAATIKAASRPLPERLERAFRTFVVHLGDLEQQHTEAVANAHRLLAILEDA